MPDFSSITSVTAAEDACRQGHLTKALLFPAELGGQDRPDNVVFIPPLVWDVKNNSIAALVSAVRGNEQCRRCSRVSWDELRPYQDYHKSRHSGMPPEYKLEIGIW